MLAMFMMGRADGQVRLPQLVRDSMVLQRDIRVRLWGWASPLERVSVHFRGKNYRAKTDTAGNWAVWLEPGAAGGPFTMTITGRNAIVLREVLVGDVWVCSGQSNMVHQLRVHNVRYEREIADAHYPMIREFWIPTVADMAGPRKDLPPGSWKWANPQDVLDFSAVAYFFARRLYDKFHVPIGLINASVGGSPIEAWMPERALMHFPELADLVAKNKDGADGRSPRRGPGFAAGNRAEPADPGLAMPGSWYDTAYMPKGWRRINIPGYWEDQGVHDLHGSVWYRRSIDLPASMTGRPAKVFLGRIVDADFLYINGRLIGNTSYMYPQRRYAVPEGVLKPGRNLFVIRVINMAGKGGFVPDKPYQLIAGTDTVDLKGDWEYKVGQVFGRRPGIGAGFSVQNQPCALYNAMIAPLTSYTIKGFCWYQGESNVDHPEGYALLQRALVTGWREAWGQGAIPFLFVQLPGFGDYRYLPAESRTAELRAAQAEGLSVPNTAMAVTIDLGEWNDIHPDRKKEVGERLALAAEKLVYRQAVVASGPTVRSVSNRGDTVTLVFDNTGSGLVTNDGEPPQEFAIAGADKKYVWAHARIAGDTVLLWSDTVRQPRYIRYAWADEPVNPNLFNMEGLPASPFGVGTDTLR